MSNRGCNVWKARTTPDSLSLPNSGHLRLSSYMRVTFLSPELVVKTSFLTTKSRAPSLYRKHEKVWSCWLHHGGCLVVHGLHHQLGIRTPDMHAYSNGARVARIL